MNDEDYIRIAKAYRNSGTSVKLFNSKLIMLGDIRIDEEETVRIRSLLQGCRNKEVRNIAEYGLVFQDIDNEHGRMVKTPVLVMNSMGKIELKAQESYLEGKRIYTGAGAYIIFCTMSNKKEIMQEINEYAPMNKYVNWDLIKNRIREIEQHNGELQFSLDRINMRKLFEEYERKLADCDCIDEFISVLSNFREYAKKYLMTYYCPIHITIGSRIDVFYANDIGKELYSNRRKISHKLRRSLANHGLFICLEKESCS